METYTSQADDFHRQANKVECPVYIPPYTSCYEALWANYELVQQAREMENAAKDIRKQFQEIAASRLSVPPLSSSVSNEENLRFPQTNLPKWFKC